MSNETEHSDATTPPAAFNLPVTGDAVPASFASVTLKVTGHMRGREGWATNVEVKRGGAVVGEVSDEGNGGGADFTAFSLDANREWREAVLAMKAILAEADDDTFSIAGEILADRLIDEALLRRDLDRKRNPVVRVGGDKDQVLTLGGGAWDESAEKWAKTYAAQNETTVERWVKGQGWETVS